MQRSVFRLRHRDRIHPVAGRSRATVRHGEPKRFAVVLQPFSGWFRRPKATPVVHNTPWFWPHGRRSDQSGVLRAAAIKTQAAAGRLFLRGRRRIGREADQSGGSTSTQPRGRQRRAEEYDQDQDQEQDRESGRIEQRGDRPMVSGNRAVLRSGVAYAPSRAPQSVKNAIWAANSLRRKPYVWGGGHGSFNDRGYDCSGTVSFALHGAGVLNSPIPSSDLMRFGERGRGRWMTVYSRPGHTFAVIAGLRLDTTDLGRGGDVGPRWYAYERNTGGYVARHPAGM
jgi:hypothetical protein